MLIAQQVKGQGLAASQVGCFLPVCSLLNVTGLHVSEASPPARLPPHLSLRKPNTAFRLQQLDSTHTCTQGEHTVRSGFTLVFSNFLFNIL